MAHPRLPALRQRYGYRSGYCGVSETDVGGELTVDHFVPLSAGGDDQESNLVYACVRCNQYKGSLPSIAAEAPGTQHLLHPLTDDVPAHLAAEQATGLLIPLSARGRFHIEALRLNRAPLLANRARRELQALLEPRLDQALAEISAIRENLELQEQYIALLEPQLQK